VTNSASLLLINYYDKTSAANSLPHIIICFWWRGRELRAVGYGGFVINSQPVAHTIDHAIAQPNEQPSAPVPPPSGVQYHLNYGNQHAVICEVGAMVREYKVNGRDVFVPFAITEAAPVYNAAVLAPWPNRLGNGSYTFEGYHGQLPVNELDRLTALHGLVCWVRWELVSSAANSVTLRYDLPAQRGWPYQLRLETTYELDDNGLSVTFSVVNLGSQTAPFGVGFHPWLSTGGANLDDCAVRVDAKQHIIANERLLPAGVEPVHGDYDLVKPKSLKGLDLDDAWIDPIFDNDGKSWTIMACPDGFAPAVWMKSPLDTWQVCSANHITNYERFGLAAEPMTCAADAFNTGAGLITLSPGAGTVVHWGAALLPADPAWFALARNRGAEIAAGAQL
jgi:aldose 1-epimerase